MPELPEVETTRRGLLPRVVGRRVNDVVVRNGSLRWPVSRGLARAVRGERVADIRRRGKYLLFEFPRGQMLVHLGMSGRLSLVAAATPPRVHDHVDVQLEGEETLRLTDPRRFGAVLWLPGDAGTHPLLKDLGPEPLEPGFTGATLAAAAKGRRVAVKQFLMNSQVVTGVGNIYASEALFHARIHPMRSVARISRESWDRLAAAIRSTFEKALSAGGSTLRDYVAADGTAGAFQSLARVYGRGGEPCRACRTPIRTLRQGQRSTFYCPRCQK
jgi:formamidopyrimidine-DNA glycosylase